MGGAGETLGDIFMPIITKHKDTTGAAVSALDTGELGVNTVDGTLSVGSAGGNVVLVSGAQDLPTGTEGQTLRNDSGTWETTSDLTVSSSGVVSVEGGLESEGAGAGSFRAGGSAGSSSQGVDAVAVGNNAGQTSQSDYAVAVGRQAGNNTQGINSVAVGSLSGATNQGTQAVAVGLNAGNHEQGNNSVAIGRDAGKTNQAANGIIINASGAVLDDTTIGHIRIASSSGSLSFINGSGWSMSDDLSVTGTGDFTGVLRGNRVRSDNFGSEAAPGFSFSSDSDTGIRRSDTNEASIVAGGADVAAFNPSGVDVTGTMVSTGVATGSRVRSSANGSTTAPSFSWSTDTDTGMYRVSTGVIGFSSNNSEVMTVGSSGVDVTGTVDATAFTGDGSGLTNLPTWGDVDGPASATNNALARFDTASGKLIQNSNATLSDAGNLDVTGTVDASAFVGDGSGLTNMPTWGDVDGPGSSTDNALARFDATTGKLLQNSNATLSDAGNLTVSGTVDATAFVGDGSGLTSLPGGGDVTGPAGATNNALARFDTTTGKLVQNSTAILSDTGDLDVSGTVDATAFVGDGSGLTNMPTWGDASGPASATNNALARFDTTSGKLLQNSSATLGDTGNLSVTGSVTAGAGLLSKGAGIDSFRAGVSAGVTSQGEYSVAVGNLAGNDTQGDSAVAVGRLSGQTDQGANAVSVGRQAGNDSQGIQSVAVGYLAGTTSQSLQAVAVGASAGETSQGASSVAIGKQAGETSQGANGIIINATGGVLNDSTAGHIHIATDDGSLDFLTASGWSMSDDLSVSGTVDATAFVGDGSGLTNLPGGGDVTGPGSATDNAVARFDSTTGKIIQNSNATISDSGDLDISGTMTSTGIATGSSVRSTGDGSAPAPAFSFSSDTDTGMYRASSGVVGFSSNNSEAMTVGSSGIDVAGTVASSSGTAGAPSHTFSGDTNNGMYLRGTDSIGFSTAGVQRMYISSTGVGRIVTDGNDDRIAGTASEVGAATIERFITCTQSEYDGLTKDANTLYIIAG